MLQKCEERTSPWCVYALDGCFRDNTSREVVHTKWIIRNLDWFSLKHKNKRKQTHKHKWKHPRHKHKHKKKRKKNEPSYLSWAVFTCNALDISISTRKTKQSGGHDTTLKIEVVLSLLCSAQIQISWILFNMLRGHCCCTKNGYVTRAQPLPQHVRALWPLNVSLRVCRPQFKALWLYKPIENISASVRYSGKCVWRAVK